MFCRSSKRPQIIADQDRVPLLQKFSYGSAAMVDVFAIWIVISVANQVFNMQMGVDPRLISLTILIFRLWDAMTDPIMGWISDNTRTRWGRRRPYIFVGAILCAITYPLMWHFPRELSEAGLFAWFLGFGLLFYTCFTIWSMPWASLLMEMTPDVNERTRVTTYRSLFQAFSAILMGATWLIIRLPVFADPITGEPDNVNGMRAVSIVLAVLFFVFGTLPAIFVKERYYIHLKKEKIPLFKSLKETLSNHSFMSLMGATILFMLGTNLVFSLGPYLSVYFVLDGNETTASYFSNYQSWIYFALNASFVYIFAWLSERKGKKYCLLLAMSLVIGAGISNWFIYDPNHPYLMLCVTVLLGPAYAGIWLMIPSMTADIIDEDELRTGTRREGSFAAVSSWVNKFSMSIAFGLSGWLLSWTGFDVAKGMDQDPQIFTTMRLIMAIVPVITVGIALFFLSRLQISTTQTLEVRKQLEAKRGII